MQQFHFIAIGGSAMHNLAIALHKQGYIISGSDDEIFNPSKSRLEKHHLLPSSFGWHPERITKKLDGIVLGMHAKKDNPELAKAHELNIPIYSYPEFLYNHAKNKTRIVIGGSHGKTSTTAMVLHVMQNLNIDTDYMVGAQLEGFDTMVRLTNKAKYMVLEGDEYLTSPIDLRPKFHLYKPHIAVITGIAWDHINVFPTFDFYVEQFRIFINKIEKNGSLFYCEEDEEVNRLVKKDYPHLGKKIGYSTPKFSIENGITAIHHNNKKYYLEIFGRHNLLNLQAARYICEEIGITTEDFYETIKSFKGASNRLEKIGDNGDITVFKDFAHAPSKLKATTQAIKEQFHERRIIAAMELHTYSSLSAEFLSQYSHSMDTPDYAFVYYNNHAIKLKRLANLSPEQVKRAFLRDDLKVFTDSTKLVEAIKTKNRGKTVVLLMSSGNFGGIDLKTLANELTE